MEEGTKQNEKTEVSKVTSALIGAQEVKLETMIDQPTD